jgi:hypothetical protein
MQDQRSTNVLIQRHPSLIEIDELVRELAHPALAQRIDEPLIHDGLRDLVASGLIHRLDDFVFASRAATRAAELAV